MTKLPIDSVMPTLKTALNSHPRVVLVAPPGAGKSTRVPLALLDESWMMHRRIFMLEPRRLAARSVARYMAAILGEQVGETVGYRVKMETRVGPKTRIEVITEGVLTRLLQSDPALESVGLLIFDEFHERSLHTDLGLALSLESQSVLREDLKILIMSATLAAEPVSAVLGNAPVVRSEGKAHPVETVFLEKPVEGRIEPAVVQAILHALAKHNGDILAFLPGAGEIRQVEQRLAASNLGRHIRISPLHGNLPLAAQDQAIAGCRPGERKVVLATSIAETSLTVEGVHIVIDSGRMRVSRFSPRTGMAHLATVPVSRSAADQRRGRAGRIGPGVCYRLWTQQEDRQLVTSSTPEILEADLAALALELAVWGTADPAELVWLDPPPAAAYQQARQLLMLLGALNETTGTITAHGRRMAEFGLHPRLAHMMLEAKTVGFGALACELAALLSERDIFRSGGPTGLDADIRLRVQALRAFGESKSETLETFQGYSFDVSLCRKICREAERWMKSLGVGRGKDRITYECGILLAFAYPDRIAKRRPNGGFLLNSGRGAVLTGVQFLSHAPYLVAAELDDQGADSRIFLAAPIELKELEQFLGEQFENQVVIAWDHTAHAVRGRKYTKLGALILNEVQIMELSPEVCQTALLQGISEEGLEILPWTRHARQLLQRLQFMHLHESGWPDVSKEVLLATLADWLGPHVYGIQSRVHLERLDLTAAITSMLTWEQRKEIDQQAPTHIIVPSGSRIPVNYQDPDSPILAVRIQEMFGLVETPRIAHGKVLLTLQLLSPAQRPVQVTRDLAGFWKNTYFDIKKDLKGRYPKHDWPDDPIHALPTRRPRPRS